MLELQEFLSSVGIPGLFVAAFLAGSILPFSSEIVLMALLLSGLEPLPLLLSASFGNIAGGATTYGFGRWVSIERTVKIFRIKEDKLDKWLIKSQKSGYILALLSWVPIIGNLILISLGLLKSHLGKTFLFMSIGKIIRYAILIWIGL